ncbi:hypothetical protein E4T38_06186 [Aureobasidium subglaciale]|nr:hypothetical protein E4T38_06186 [Aureobasidium subglaciale]KAI5219823.1 hypothetical protein E4T40_06207 [Aureobasidium subglaciale]KAI5223667.1 hypothetical protein E4T41_05990 [Aureobasidium subglaciale]KAI5260500.1 hypothetical protein E4T46_05941 [Aureobasidium subglaciale]
MSNSQDNEEHRVFLERIQGFVNGPDQYPSNPAGIPAPQFNPFEDTTNDGDPPINFTSFDEVLQQAQQPQQPQQAQQHPRSNQGEPFRGFYWNAQVSHDLRMAESLSIVPFPASLLSVRSCLRTLIDVKQGLNSTTHTRAILNPSADPFLPARSQDGSGSMRIGETYANGFAGPPSVRRVAGTLDDVYSTNATWNAGQDYFSSSQRTSVNPSGNENYGGGFLLRGPASARRPARITNGFDSTNANSNSRYSYPGGNPGLDGGQGTQMHAAIHNLSDHRNTMGYNDGNSYNDYSTPAGRSFGSYRASGRREPGGFGEQERTMASPAPRTPSGMPKTSQNIASKKRRSSLKTKVPRIGEPEQEKEGEEDKQGSPEIKPDKSGSGRKAANTKKRTEKEKADRKHARQRARGMRTQAHNRLEQGLMTSTYIERNPEAEEDLGGLEEVMDQLRLSNIAQHEAADSRLKEVDDELEEMYQNRHKR